jgi:predicted ATPase
MARATVAAGPAKKATARKPAVPKTEPTGPCLLRSLCAQNLLSFGPDASPLELGSLNVLIGPNGSGKSNLLDVVALLRSSAQELQREILRGGGILEWIWKGQPEGQASLVAEVTSPSTQETLRHSLFLQQRAQSFSLNEERVFRGSTQGQALKLLYHRPPSGRVKIVGSQGLQVLAAGAIDPSLSILVQRRDPEGFPEITFLADAYSKIRVYRDWVLGRSAGLRQPQRTDMRSDRLDEDFSNLGLVLSRLGRKPKARMDILTRLRDLYEGISSFDLSVEGGTVQVFFTEGDFTVPATRLSDGTLRYLGLLAILCDPQPPPLVCLEEPELGLHPDLIPKIADLLVEASSRTQLIVTTHSDILIDALTDRPESVIVCEKHEGQTTMQRLDRSDLSVWLESYRLGELWTRGHLGGNRW